MPKYLLEIVVFLCGAALMILELTGSRVLAPFIGTSTIVWTSLIGIIMGALSLGYFVGGKMADKNPTALKLALVILAAAASVFVVIPLNSLILSLIQEVIRNLYAGAVIATVFLFSVPSFLLGIVSPYAVKLKVKDLGYAGRTVGNLYAVSTIGSIAGTFAAGFFLIPFLGTINILYFITALLVFTSIIISGNKLLKIKLALVLILMAVIIFSLVRSAKAEAGQHVDVDSQYNRILIYSYHDSETGRPTLNILTDPFGIQSGMFSDRDDDLVYKYSKYYRLGDVVNPGINNALMIGGAAYSYPKDFLKKHASANLDVVEIDPKMTELARKYFNLKDDPRLSIYHEDARVFLNNNKKKYDAIYVDAFNSHLSIPYQLTTKEAVTKIFNSLNDKGVVIVNIISSIEGDRGKFLRAEYATYKSVFPQLYLFRVYNTDQYKIQNLILVAVKGDAQTNLKSDNAELYSMIDNIWRQPVINDLPIFTDDFAPVDYYALSMVK
jgi:predicted membrane-bound spermidine synthase